MRVRSRIGNESFHAWPFSVNYCTLLSMDSEEKISLKRKHDDESTSDSLDPITGGESSIDPIWNIERCSSPLELDRSPIINTKKIKTKKNVRFEDVTVYYFARSQSFISVPSQGTITLGMSLSRVLRAPVKAYSSLVAGMVPEHSHVEQYSVAEFSRLRHALHKSILRERKILPPASASSKQPRVENTCPLMIVSPPFSVGKW